MKKLLLFLFLIPNLVMGGELNLNNKGFFCGPSKYVGFRALWCENSECIEFIINGYKIEAATGILKYKAIGTDKILFFWGEYGSVYYQRGELNRKTLEMGPLQCKMVSSKKELFKPLEEIASEAKNNNKI
jgi:hypothetical protein